MGGRKQSIKYVIDGVRVDPCLTNMISDRPIDQVHGFIHIEPSSVQSSKMTGSGNRSNAHIESGEVTELMQD